MKALVTQGSYVVSKRRPALVRRILRALTKAQLPDGYDVDTHFNPRYDPWDQRLCVVPDGDLFKAIRSGTASVVTDEVDTFTPDGVRLRSGEELPADVVVTATGLELLFIGGIEVSVDGEALHLPDKLTYKGMMLEGVPNMALAVGYTNASWTLKCDLTCAYVTRLLNHMRASGLRQCTARNDDASVTAAPLLGPLVGLHRPGRRPLPPPGVEVPLEGAPELPPRPPGPEAQRHPRRRHGLLQPGPRRRSASRALPGVDPRPATASPSPPDPGPGELVSVRVALATEIPDHYGVSGELVRVRVVLATRSLTTTG